MTKKALLELLAQYPDEAEIVIDVDDTIHEDLYDFTFEPISWTRFHENGISTGVQMHELRLCPIEQTNE